MIKVKNMPVGNALGYYYSMQVGSVKSTLLFSFPSFPFFFMKIKLRAASVGDLLALSTRIAEVAEYYKCSNGEKIKE